MKLTDVELEERVRRLEGQVLRGVTYQGVSVMHAVRHAVFLELDQRIEITADDVVGIGHGAGIALRERKVVDPAYGAVVDAGSTEIWAGAIGGVITRAMLRWEDVYDSLRSSLATGVAIHADYLRRRDYPATLELAFGDRTILITAARLDLEGGLHPLEFELVVRASSA